MSSARKLVFLLAVVGVLVYAAFNVWMFRYAKNSKELKGDSLPKQGVTFTGTVIPSVPSPTPTPRPTGPGQYACSPAGDCNLYGDAMRTQFCTQTYGDNLCLDQCGDKSKLCTK